MHRIKNIFLSIVTFLMVSFAYGQNFKEDFSKYQKENDTLKQKKTLDAWELSKPNDPELFIASFNYHYNKSRNEYIGLTTEKPEGESLAVYDSLNQIAGYLGANITFDKPEFNVAINIIDKGIELYPNRLDMRFGKIFVLGNAKKWNTFTEEILKAIQHSSTNNNKWTWTDNEVLEEGKEVFLSSIQDYQLQLFNTGNDDLLKNMKQIAEKILKYYPEHIESMSNLSIVYLLNGAYDEAINILLKAEKINPKDCIILFNIAYAYNMNGDTKNEKTCYKKIIKYGNDEEKSTAKDKMKKL